MDLPDGTRLSEPMATLGASAARLLHPVFAANDQTWGRLSIQTDPTLHHDSSAMLRQSVALAALGPNMQVKMPATSAGLAMVEDATFSRRHRERDGELFRAADHRDRRGSRARAEPTRALRARHGSYGAGVATMIGRLDDWTKVVADRDRVAIDLRRIPAPRGAASALPLDRCDGEGKGLIPPPHPSRRCSRYALFRAHAGSITKTSVARTCVTWARSG